MTGHPEILKLLKHSIDSEGNILDSASPLLKELWTRAKRLENRIRKTRRAYKKRKGFCFSTGQFYNAEVRQMGCTSKDGLKGTRAGHSP